MNLADLALRHADTLGDKTAIRMDADSLTYAELARDSERVARGLRDLGVAAGDRVVIFAENRVEYLVAYIATARLGAIFTPIHASFQSHELDFVMSNAAPTVIIAQQHLWERLNRSGAAFPGAHKVVLGPATDDLLSFDDLGQDSTVPVGTVDCDAGTPALICYTSGTTARPNPVTRAHGHEIWNAETYADVWDYRTEDLALVTLPLSWVWGLSTLCAALLSVGATIVLHREFDSVTTLEEIQESGITLFAGTMSMFVAIHAALQERSYDLTSLRRVYRGGEPLNDEIVRALEVRLGLRLIDAYATTEAAPVIAVDPVRDVNPPAGTAGRLVPGAEIKIVDADGRDVERGEVGEAWLGGKGIMLGYWNAPDLTAARLTKDGWFKSGDYFVEGVDGYYFVVGRSSDVIIRNGAKIAPAEVESALTGLIGVQDAVIVGVPDEEFGELIVAYLVPEPGCVVTVDGIYDQLSDQIARFKLPSHIYFVDEIPTRRNQKRDRAAVRRHAFSTVGAGTGPDHGSTTIQHRRVTSADAG